MALTYRFLFDECLSPTLVLAANTRGYEATTVKYLNRLGDSDPTLALLCVDRDYVFVTNNRTDYARIYRRFDMHPGLVIVIPQLTVGNQHRVFGEFCDRLSTLDDLVNKLVDIYEDGRIEVQDWPPIIANDPDP